MSVFNLFESDSLEKIVSSSLDGCDDGELYVEDNTSESFIFDDNVYLNKLKRN